MKNQSVFVIAILASACSTEPVDPTAPAPETPTAPAAPTPAMPTPAMPTPAMPTPAMPPTAATALLPLQTGRSWTYRVRDGNDLYTKTTTVHELTTVGGTGPNAQKPAYRVVSLRRGMINGKPWTATTESWQGVLGEAVVRYREVQWVRTLDERLGDSTPRLPGEDSWEPWRLVVDGSAARTTRGAVWTLAYTERSLPFEAGSSALLPRTVQVSQGLETWTVLAVDEAVTVPKGTFTCVRLRKTVNGAVSKSYWWAPGIGKVKEVGGQTEDLIDFVAR